MLIRKVIATDIKSKQKVTFNFATASGGKDVVTLRGGKLNRYLEYVFKEGVDCQSDVEVWFDVNSDKFILSRTHGDNGGSRSVLKKYVDGHWQVAARNRAVNYVEDLINEQLADMLKINYVNNKAIADFHGNLQAIDEIALLADINDGIAKSMTQADALKQNALRRVREYSADANDASFERLDEVNSQLDAVARDITVATAQLGELKAKQGVDALRKDIEAELDKSQIKYGKLMSRHSEIEDARAKVKLRDDLELVIPKVKTLKSIGQQRGEHDRRRQEIQSELDWQQNELDVITKQLEEKQQQFDVSQDKRNRIERINGELSYIASLYDKNKRLNETLLELNDQQERLTAEKALYNNKLENIEKSINEVRESLDSFEIPASSVSELLELVRVDVKIDEVNAQIDKLQSEITVRESQIAEKESNLVIKVKRFRAVADLDVAVTPIKAKDTILQVLDTKYSKLESINTSLKEKQRNFERALEDYKYRIIQLEQSRNVLVAERDKAMTRKQEEFKREVYLNSQKVYSDDSTGVFAVTANFHDQEMEDFDKKIVQRNLDRDNLLERAFNLDGAIKEIKRHIEINSAEMESLQREKDNINARYNEIVAQNSSEAVFNYLKALSTDNGTKYLLDMQQDSVRSEAELAELKRTTEAQRTKLSSLKSRLKYLQETQQSLDDGSTSIDSLIATNDKIKDELTDIGGRLSSGYEQYKAVSRQLESVESKLEDVRAAIIEVSKTVKVNENQIAESTEKAKVYAGSDNIEQAVANFKYELGDVESERQMLIESKQNAEREVFKKRLDLEKAQWLYETKCAEYRDLYQELQFELNLKGLDVDKIAAMDFDINLDGLRKIIAEYDTTCANVSEKIDNLCAILKSQPVFTFSPDEIAQKEAEIAKLQSRQRELEASRNRQLSSYAAASTARQKATVAATEARTLANMRDAIHHNKIIALLIDDKLNSIVNSANKYLQALTSNRYKLVRDKFRLFAVCDNQTLEYDALPDDIKAAAYISVLLGAPNTDTSDGRWLIFEERIAIDKKSLSAMLRKVGNLSYVVSVTK